MRNLKCAIVLTTINKPILLDGYFENLKKFGHVDQVEVIVIPDKKTPSGVFDYCRSLNNAGFKTMCPTLEEQEEYLKKIGIKSHFIPFNSDNRRNIGFLMALELKIDFIISIDDDNYCKQGEDFFAEHSVVCHGLSNLETVNAEDQWFNICSLLKLNPNQLVYPRGYPYYNRMKKSSNKFVNENHDVRLNAGLWLDQPDFDGLTWLASPVNAIDFKNKSIALGKNTWSPINTQNTGLGRDVIPCYYFVRMGYSIGGLVIDRYGDIFSGYFSQKCIKHFKHGIRIGTPVADHIRNSHNYLKDVTSELACIWTLEDILPWLQEVKLSGLNYVETYESLSYALEDAVEEFSGFIWTDSTKGYFHQMGYCMRQWALACKQIIG